MIHRPWDTTDLIAMASRSDLPQHPTTDRTRSSGLHISDLYHKLYPKELNDITPQELNTYAILGLALEDRLERALIELGKRDGYHVERPKEIESEEGLFGSPDLFILQPPRRPLIIGEMKAPWKSSGGCPKEEGENGFPSKFDIYLCQVMAYAHVVDTLDGLLIIYFVNGDWSRRPPRPQLLAWELEFSLQEREENWDALIQIACEME